MVKDHNSLRGQGQHKDTDHIVSSVIFYEDHWKRLLYFFLSRLQFLSFGVHSWALNRASKCVILKCDGHSKLLKNFTMRAAKAGRGGAQS